VVDKNKYISVIIIVIILVAALFLHTYRFKHKSAQYKFMQISDALIKNDFDKLSYLCQLEVGADSFALKLSEFKSIKPLGIDSASYLKLDSFYRQNNYLGFLKEIQHVFIKIDGSIVRNIEVKEDNIIVLKQYFKIKSSNNVLKVQYKFNFKEGTLVFHYIYKVEIQ